MIHIRSITPTTDSSGTDSFLWCLGQKKVPVPFRLAEGTRWTDAASQTKTKRRCHSKWCIAFVLLCHLLISVTARAADFTVGNHQIVDRQRVSRTDVQFTLSAQVTNAGPGTATNVKATLTIDSPNTTVVDGNLTFGDVAPGATVTSQDTFVIHQNRRFPFDPALMQWSVTFDPPLDAIPPDPATVAPPLNTTEVTRIADATSFLYTGDNPIQTGVESGIIVSERAAVIRGKVLNRNNQPLSGVTITIKNHPKFGQTLSRADGMFDMAVNGGGVLFLNYDKAGYLPVQRQINAPWQDYVIGEDVVMIPVDSQVTAIDLTSNAVLQVAQGSVQTDEDGARQATVIFPQGTSATVTLPDGSTQPLTTLNVRATEYTVGANGPEAMPGELPPTSGYTYAVELSVDEAIAVGATRVNFSQPIPFYVDNFLNFPTGEVVPVGWYDRNKAAWMPSKNGRIIEVLGIEEGLAQLDIDGSGSVADATMLSGLGITDAEREHMASTYTAGKTLWRVQIEHFTPWDCNWPYGPPEGAEAPPSSKDNANTDPEDNSECPGSIIEPQTQTLGEDIPIVGTPFSLHYRSNRTAGYKANRTLDIVLTQETIPADLKRIDLKIEVAGQIHQFSFDNFTPNQSYVFVWDGLDAYGRELLNATATVTLGYVYDLVYYAASSDFEASFAQFGASSSNTSSGNLSVIGSRFSQEVAVEQTWRTALDVHTPMINSLGGWSLSILHSYDPVTNIFYSGDGGKRSAQSINDIVDIIAITEANIGGIDVDASGNVYFTQHDNFNSHIRRLNSDGSITTVVGTFVHGIGSSGYNGDNIPATTALLNFPRDVALGPDGSIYIADHSNHRIRRIKPDGIITTVAGNGFSGFSGDGGLAIDAGIASPEGVAVAPDGSIYIADAANNRIRCVGPDEIITTVAGDGQNVFGGDGGPAINASFPYPTSVAFGPDGSLYFFEVSRRVRRVGPDGIITTVAGGGLDSVGDGILATDARLDFSRNITVDLNGRLYISDSSKRIRRVGLNNIINTIVGGGNVSIFKSDGHTATAVNWQQATGVAIGPDRNLYIATHNKLIGRVSTAFPKISLGEILIPSHDGSQLHVFDSQGRHLRTLDAITGTTLFSFEYTTDGLLSTVTDVDNDVTTIERLLDGTPAAIIGPDGQRTDLTLDANGYLNSISNPAGDTHDMVYTDDGLMTKYTNPRGQTNELQYDAAGRLKSDSDPLGGGWTLDRTDNDSGHTVTMTSGEGRVSSFQVEPLPTGDRRQVNTAPDGTSTVTVHGTDGTETITTAEGVEIFLQEGPDPRFRMLSPVPEEVRITTPGGLINARTTTRAASLADEADLLSHTSLTETVTINGRAYSQVFDTATMTYTDTSPEGRTRAQTIDAKGRMTQQIVPGVDVVDFDYDNRGRLDTVSTGSGAAQRNVVFTYGSDGYLEILTDAESRQVQFEYDLAGRVTQQTLPDGRAIGFSYDANGNLTSLTPPGRPAHSFTYTDVDDQANYTPPDVSGVTQPSTQYSYNLDSQLELVTRPDGKTIDLNYHPTSGRLTDVVIPRGTYTYQYSTTSGQLDQIVAPNVTLGFGYDGSLPTTVTWTGAIAGNVSQSYNNDFLVTQRCVNAAHCIDFGYDNDLLIISAGDLTLDRDTQNGLITGSTLSSVTTSRGYNSFAEMTSYSADYDATDVYDVTYTRDKIGRIVQLQETIQGVATTYDYHYDLAGRLDEVKTNGVVTASYQYDANSNRTHVNSTLVGTYDNQDRLAQYEAMTYTYTDNGELSSKTDTSINQAIQYNYDVFGNLIHVTLPDATKIDYIIDGRNRRVGKKVNNVLRQGFLYKDQLNPVAELDGAGNVIARFVYADKANVPAYMIKGSNTYRIISDHLGSPRLVVNVADGTVQQRMDYDVWGNVTNDTNPGFQPFGFAGGLYDIDTKLVRYGARDYDPYAGRWTSKDPILFAGGDTNLYGYSINDPVNFIDQNGKLAFNLASAVVGGIIGGVSAALNGGSFSDVVGGVAGGVVGGFSGGLLANLAISALKQIYQNGGLDCFSFGDLALDTFLKDRKLVEGVFPGLNRNLLDSAGKQFAQESLKQAVSKGLNTAVNSTIHAIDGGVSSATGAAPIF